MKTILQRVLQKFLGFRSYLWIFTLYKIRTLRKDANENDFFYFLKLLPENARVLDIGANLGLMSYHLCRSNKVSSVDAFEPIPDNLFVLYKLRKRFRLEQLFIHPFALGNENKTLELILPVVEGVKKQGLAHVSSEKIQDFNEGVRMEVLAYRLDDFSALKNRQFDAIKIDVENFEYEVFMGALNILNRDKPMIYCELWDNQNRKDCFKLLSRIGYKIYVHENGSLRLLDTAKTNTQNFFFIHSES